MADTNLGSASVGVEIDLKALQGQLNTAAKMISQMTQTANKQTAAGTATGGGGIFSQIFSGLKEASFGMSLVGNFDGVLGRLGTTAGGVTRIFQGMSSAAGGSGAAMSGVGIAVAGILAVVAAGVLAFKGLEAAIKGAFSTLSSAGDAQATATTFEILAGNMGITTEATDAFAESLEKMNYFGSEQTRIMTSLLRSQVGLTDTSLAAVTAMRDLSVAAGVGTVEGIETMGTAITRLNPQLLENYGINQTATQMFDQYAATLGRTGDSLSVAERKQAMLNAVIDAGAASAGAANAANNDLNRLITRLSSNFETLKAGIGQVFLPLASGIVGIINTEVLGLSKSVDDNANKFESMGQAIADAVIPTIKGLIAWLKAIDWNKVANDAYVTAQVFVGIGQVAVLVGQAIFGAFKVVGLVIATVVHIARQLFNLLTALTSTVIAFFMALADPDNASSYMTAIDQTWSEFGSDFTATASAVFDEINETMEGIEQPMTDTIGGIMDTIENAMTGFSLNSFWNGLADDDTGGAGRVVKSVTDTAGQMSAATLKAIKKMAEELAKENEDFARSQAKAAADYETQLAELVAQHRDQMAQIKADIAKEQKSYDKAYADRTLSYQDELNKLAKADDDRKRDVNMQLAEELAKGRFADQTKIASLRSRLEYEDSANKESVASAEAAYNEDIANLKTTFDERMAELQIRLDEEIAIKKKYEDDFVKYKDYIIADDITKLKLSYKERAAEDLRAHNERVANIIKNGAESAQAAAQAGQNEGSSYGAGYGSGLTNSLKNSESKVADAAKTLGQTIGDEIAAGIKESKLGGSMGGGYAGGGGGGGGGGGWGDDSSTSFWDIILSNLKNFAHFSTGGIMGGRGGVDNNLAAISNGEMILNSSQQSRMFSLLDGRLAASGSSSSGSGIVIENMNVTLPGVSNASEFSRELKLKLSTMRAI